MHVGFSDVACMNLPVKVGLQTERNCRQDREERRKVRKMRGKRQNLIGFSHLSSLPVATIPPGPNATE